MTDILDMALLKNAVLIKLDLRAWGNIRKARLPKGVVEKIVGSPTAPAALPVETPEEKEARLKKAERMMGLTKALVISPEYQACKKFCSEFKAHFISRYCNPSFIDKGMFTIRRMVDMPDGSKKDLLKEAVEELELAKKELAETYVPRFLAAYPKQVADAAGVLNGQFNPRDYPGISLENGTPVFSDEKALADRFDIRWRITRLSVPEGLPPEIQAEEERKLRESYQQAEQQIVSALYSGFASMVEKIVDRMRPDPETGKAKTFQYTTLENLMEFIQNFRNKNVFNDVRLQDMVAKAQDILSTIGNDPKQMSDRLRDYEGLRNRTELAFEALKEEIDKAVSELPARTMTIVEEEEPTE